MMPSCEPVVGDALEIIASYSIIAEKRLQGFGNSAFYRLRRKLIIRLPQAWHSLTLLNK